MWRKGDVIPIWTKVNCQACDRSFYFTRTMEREYQGQDFLCPECDCYNDAFKEGFNHGYSKGKTDKKKKEDSPVDVSEGIASIQITIDKEFIKTEALEQKDKRIAELSKENNKLKKEKLQTLKDYTRVRAILNDLYSYFKWTDDTISEFESKF